jgi:hypothetical protein
VLTTGMTSLIFQSTRKASSISKLTCGSDDSETISHYAMNFNTRYYDKLSFFNATSKNPNLVEVCQTMSDILFIAK